MSLSIIVAKASNNAIGKDNALLWHLSDDLKRFKKLTMGHPIIMGRKTFESLPGVLPAAFTTSSQEIRTTKRPKAFSSSTT